MPPPPVQQADDHAMNNVVADASMNYFYGGGAMVFGGGAPMGETVEQAAPPVPAPVAVAPVFLRGLRVYGRGEWKSISMNFVRSKTPVQVSSHAQKYFRRVESAAADKQRYSINDVGLNDDTAAMDGTNSYSNNNFGGWQSLIQQQFMQMQAQTQQAWNDQHMMMAAAPMEGATDTNFEPAEQQHVLNF
nr:transcription factor MYBS1 [Oryza sativa Japonica Group]